MCPETCSLVSLLHTVYTITASYLIVRTDDWLKACSYQIPDAVGRSAIKVAAILTMLNELSTLDVNLHLKIVQETF